MTGRCVYCDMPCGEFDDACTDCVRDILDDQFHDEAWDDYWDEPNIATEDGNDWW